MPLYEYRCQDCDHRFEILQPVGAGASGLECPCCGERDLAKQFSTFAAASGNGASASAAGTAPAGGCCRGTPT